MKAVAIILAAASLAGCRTASSDVVEALEYQRQVIVLDDQIIQTQRRTIDLLQHDYVCTPKVDDLYLAPKAPASGSVIAEAATE